MYKALKCCYDKVVLISMNQTSHDDLVVSFVYCCPGNSYQGHHQICLNLGNYCHVIQYTIVQVEVSIS